MECPKCHKKGNLLRKVFGNHDRKQKIKYCFYCGTKVKIFYHWGRIFLLFLAVLAFVMLVHYLLIYFKQPGLTPILAGGITAILLLFFMQTKPFMKINILNEKNK